MDQPSQGVVVAARGRFFEVLTLEGQRLSCELRQKVKRGERLESLVVVGDDVVVSLGGGDVGSIEKVLPRRTAFFRPAKGSDTRKQIIASNLDQLAIIVSVQSPPLRTGLIDRFLVAADIGHLKPLLVITKVDMGRSEDHPLIVQTYREIGVPVCCVSNVTGEGMDHLQTHLKDHRTLFIGHSGVGKSTLLNGLSPGLNLRTKSISEYSDRGRHTTTGVELYEMPFGGYAADSPGLKVMGLWEVEREELADHWPEFAQWAGNCRFQPCRHYREPDCAVKAAVEEGAITRFRYENYTAIFDSIDNEW